MNTAQLPEPNECHACCSENIEHVQHRKVRHMFIWRCKDCAAAVGCHEGTKLPLGLMADRDTRELRARAHKHFDRLWQDDLTTRERAYTWLAHVLQVDREICHIGFMNAELLRRTIEVAIQRYDELARVEGRRRAKRYEKRGERHRIERGHIERRKNNRRKDRKR